MKGLIIAGTNNLFTVECEDEVIRNCTIKGKVIKTDKEFYNPIAPGDVVKIDPDPINDKKGQVIIGIKDLVPDTYIVNITFKENAVYLSSNALTKITVNKKITKFILNESGVWVSLKLFHSSVVNTVLSLTHVVVVPFSYSALASSVPSKVSVIAILLESRYALIVNVPSISPFLGINPTNTCLPV